MKRDPWLDNVKMVLVTFVVIGHAIVLVPEPGGPGLKSHLYDFIYLWHIPAFVLVTGYFSRSFRWTRRHLTALVTTIGIPYVIFELAMYWFRAEVGGVEFQDLPVLNPHWPMWYLVGVFCWRLLTPLLQLHWLMVPASILASLVFATGGTEFFDLNRVIGLLPFFAVGLHLPDRAVEALRSRTSAVVGAVVLIAAWFGIGQLDDWAPHPATWSATKWLWYSQPYDVFGVSGTEAFATRLTLIACSTVVALAVLAVVPRGRSFLTGMGAASLVVYLFHGFFVRGAEFWGFPEWAARQGAWTLWLTVAAAVALAVGLAWPPVARRLNVVVDPWGSWQRRKAVRETTAA